MATTTIDNSTKVNLGILCTLLVATAGGAASVSTVNAKLAELTNNSEKATAAILRIEHKVDDHGRQVATLQEADKSHARRLDILESKVLR